MRQRLPIVLSVTALLVAILGWTPVGEAGEGFLFPKNSIGKRELKKSGVGTKQIARAAVGRGKLKKNVITGPYVKNNSLDSADIEDESLLGEDILDESIEGEDIEDDSLRGEDIFEESLGIVPEADQVDGKDASCPSGTAEIADLCMETSARDASGSGWTGAATDCGSWGGRIPTLDELYYARTVAGWDLSGAEITSTLYGDAGTMEYMSVTDSGTIGSPGMATPNQYRCVKDILN